MGKFFKRLYKLIILLGLLYLVFLVILKLLSPGYTHLHAQLTQYIPIYIWVVVMLYLVYKLGSWIINKKRYVAGFFLIVGFIVFSFLSLLFTSLQSSGVFEREHNGKTYVVTIDYSGVDSVSYNYYEKINWYTMKPFYGEELHKIRREFRFR